MIPYFEFHILDFGIVKIQVWGLMVSIGFLVSLLILRKEAVKKKLDWEIIINLFLGILLVSFIFARLFYIFWGGGWQYFFDNPLAIFAVWNGGFSSFGGFLGAFLFLALYFKKTKLPFFKYVDVLTYTFPFGWIIGRLGCFFIHDHLGVLTNSFLAINFLGGHRFDMALLEILILLPLLLIFIFLSRKIQPEKIYLMWLLLWYGTSRFFLDFLRAGDTVFFDPRYFNLTIAQWGSIILIILGVYLILTRGKGRFA